MFKYQLILLKIFYNFDHMMAIELLSDILELCHKEIFLWDNALTKISIILRRKVIGCSFRKVFDT